MARQARSEQTRRLLLDAAAELLRRHGYADTSMVDIARAAGVTKGGLYFHFSSKDEICDGVQDEAVAVLREHVDRVVAGRPTAMQRLADLGRALMRWLDTDAKVAASFRLAREMGAKDARFVSFCRAWVAQVHQYVTDARANGELNTDAPLDMTALHVVLTCVGLESVASTGVVRLDDGLEATLAALWQRGVREPTDRARLPHSRD